MTETKEYDPHGRAKLDLTAHCLLKGVQAGSVAGSLIVLVRLLRSALGRGQALTLPAVAMTMLNAQAWGTVLAGLMELGVVLGKGVDEEGIEDRAYRIHYNKGQNRTDRFAGAGYAAGAVAGVALGGLQPVMMLGLGGVGCAGGILAHVASSNFDNTSEVTSK